MVFLLVVGFCVWHDLQSMQSMNKVLSVLKNKQYTINIHTLEVTVRFSESNWQRSSLDFISFFINTKAVESFALCRLKSAIPFAPWNHQSWKRIPCVIYVALLAWGQRTDYWFKFNKLLALVRNNTMNAAAHSFQITNSSITARCHINSTKMIWILSLMICLRWWHFFFLRYQF